MAKKNNWYSKSLKINFNYKEWRQDLAEFIKKKQFWDYAIVTKAKSLSSKKMYGNKGHKYFEIYDGKSRYVKILYKNLNEVIAIEPTNFDKELVDEYFIKRNLF